MRSAGEQLYVNGLTTEGEITCELLDGAGDPVPGFAREDCIPFTGDSARHGVGWKGQNRLPPPSIGPIRLRVHLRRAQLFSLWFE
jgi:hypothetical protein